MQNTDYGTFYRMNHLVPQVNQCMRKGVKGAPVGEKNQV